MTTKVKEVEARAEVGPLQIAKGGGAEVEEGVRVAREPVRGHEAVVWLLWGQDTFPEVVLDRVLVQGHRIAHAAAVFQQTEWKCECN